MVLAVYREGGTVSMAFPAVEDGPLYFGISFSYRGFIKEEKKAWL